MRKSKLVALRWGFIILLSLLILVWKFTRIKKIRKIAIPSIWLRHYLLGSGKPMNLPPNIVNDSMYQTLLEGIRYGGKVLDSRFYNNDDNSLIFSNLVGGFSYHKVEEDNDGSIIIQSVDSYDWHPADNIGSGYKSQIFESWLFGFNLINWFFGKLFPKEYFLFTNGKVAISHKLWHDMENIGARSFNTVINIHVPKEHVEKYKRERQRKKEEKLKELTEEEQKRQKYEEEIIKIEIGSEQFEKTWFFLKELRY